MVSPVLNNVIIQYPDLANVQHQNLPLGFINIDNLFNHMTSHRLCMITQRTAFHVHLSPDTGYANLAEKKLISVGFLKLYYLFEPLFLSVIPTFRANHEYCQTVQSVFTIDEIRNQTIDMLYNDIANGINVSGNRRINHVRYCALNFTNLETNKATIEWRSGVANFNSAYTQTIIHLLQVLFMYNIFLCSAGNLDIHHQIIDECSNAQVHGTNIYFPSYVAQTTAQYDTTTLSPNFINDNTLRGRPTEGIFTYLNSETCGRIVNDLLIKFVGLTGSYPLTIHLLEYLKFFHDNDKGGPLYKNIDI